MLALFSLWILQPPSFAIGQIDIDLIELYDEEQLSSVASGAGSDYVRSFNFHILLLPK